MIQFDEHIFQMGWFHQLVFGFLLLVLEKRWNLTLAHSYRGEDSQFDYSDMFQIGWNHLDKIQEVTFWSSPQKKQVTCFTPEKVTRFIRKTPERTDGMYIFS